ADEQNQQLVGSQADIRLTLNVAVDDQSLRAYERVLLAALFGFSPPVPTDVLLSKVKPQLDVSIPIIEDRLYTSITQEGLFSANPRSTRQRWRVTGGAVAVAGTAFAVLAESLLGSVIGLAWLPGIALALIGFCLVALAGRMPRRTQRGALEAARWRAFS